MSDVVPCPYCKFPCHCDEVDVGIGMVQCGPYHCERCGATEIGPHDEERELSDIERKTGWYKPYSEPGSSANVIDGKVVTAEQMRAVYHDHFKDNPDWLDKKYVEKWHKDIRQPGVRDEHEHD